MHMFNMFLLSRLMFLVLVMWLTVFNYLQTAFFLNFNQPTQIIISIPDFEAIFCETFPKLKCFLLQVPCAIGNPQGWFKHHRCKERASSHVWVPLWLWCLFSNIWTNGWHLFNSWDVLQGHHKIVVRLCMWEI